MYYVYYLIDYKGYPFYIGVTRNLKIRIREHEQNKNATPAKSYRVRRVIKEKGFLPYKYNTFTTKEEAIKAEAKAIHLLDHQLVNKTHGRVKRECKQRRSKGQSQQCKFCLNWFKRISTHVCSTKNHDSDL